MYNFHGDLLKLYKPIPTGNIVNWCQENIYIPPGTSDEPGYISFLNRPWQKQILEDFANPAIKEQHIKASQQISKTLLMTCLIQWRMAHANTSIMTVFPSLNKGTDFQETRLNPILENIPEIQEKIKCKHDDKKASKIFSDGSFRIVGAGSDTALASTPVEALFCDEVSKYGTRGEDSIEADPIRLAFERTASFSHPKIYTASTPNIENDTISRLYTSGNQLVWMMPCPHCQTPFDFRFEYLHFPDCKNENTKVYDIEEVRRKTECRCPFCNNAIKPEQKQPMINAGEWVALNPAAPASVRSYHISRFYAPGTSFADIQAAFAEEYNNGNTKNFKNSWLGISWDYDVQVSDRYQLDLRNVDADKASQQKSVLILSVDVQGEYATPYFYFIIREWHIDGNSKMIAKGKAENENELEQIISTYKIQNENIIMDSNYNMPFVISFAQKHFAQKIINGKPLFLGMVLGNGRYSKNGFSFNKVRNNSYTITQVKADNKMGWHKITFVPDRFKDYLQLLRLQKGKNRWLIDPKLADDDYFRQLNSEKRIRRKNGEMGWGMPDITSKQRKNHFLDCEVLNLVFARVKGYIKF